MAEPIKSSVAKAAFVAAFVEASALLDSAGIRPGNPHRDDAVQALVKAMLVRDGHDLSRPVVVG